MMEHDKVIESFLSDIYPLNEDPANESNFVYAISTLVGTALLLAIPWVGGKIAAHKQNKATLTETDASVHLTAFKKADWDLGKKYIDAAKAAAEKARGMTSGNPEIAELKKVYDENIEKHRKLLKDKCQKLAFFSGSDLSRLNALIRRYSWFAGATIKPQDQKGAIMEMDIHISREKEYKYDKYWMAFLRKFRDAIKSVEGKNLWLSITD